MQEEEKTGSEVHSVVDVALPRDVNQFYEVTTTIIGKGAFGTVLKGTRKDGNQPVAVKVIKTVHQGQSQLASIRAEVNCLKCLDHPNIVKLFDFFETPTLLHICMEVVKGGELFDRITQKQHYSEKDARDLVLTLIGTVKHCHDNCIVHRDVKAENLLMVSDEDDADVKLVDFGFASKAEGNSLDGLMGTPEYMAPEIWGNKIKYGAPVDMWALGVLSYIILVGYPPFYDPAPLRLKTKIIRGMYDFHPQYWDKISEEAKHFVTRLLTVDMGGRMTAEQALQHPWLVMCENELATRKLEESIGQMKRFNARRRLKASCNAVLAIGKMSRLLSIFRSKSGSMTNRSDCKDDDILDGIHLDDPAASAPQTPREPSPVPPDTSGTPSGFSLETPLDTLDIPNSSNTPRSPCTSDTPLVCREDEAPISKIQRRKSFQTSVSSMADTRSWVSAHDLVIQDPLSTDEELYAAVQLKIRELEEENREILLTLPLAPPSPRRSESPPRSPIGSPTASSAPTSPFAPITPITPNTAGEGKNTRESKIDTHPSSDTTSTAGSIFDPVNKRLRLEENLSIIRSLLANMLE